jgi:hypothetical protein
LLSQSTANIRRHRLFLAMSCKYSLLLWLDPAITTAAGENENGNDMDKGQNANDSESDSPEPAHWMPMRVCVRWMYRLSDVVEEKGRDVPGHNCEVFVSDHVTGPDVNSVNVIDGRAILTEDRTVVPASCVMNAKGERVYFCNRFYRHEQAPKPPRGMFPRHANVRVKTIRMLAPGELENIMCNPTDSVYLFYAHVPEDKAAGRRSIGRPRREEQVEETDGNRTPAPLHKKRRIGVNSDDNSEDEGERKRTKRDGSQSAPHGAAGARGDTTSLRPRRRSSIAATERTRQLRSLYVDESSGGESDNDEEA